MTFGGFPRNADSSVSLEKFKFRFGFAFNKNSKYLTQMTDIQGVEKLFQAEQEANKIIQAAQEERLGTNADGARSYTF